MKCWSTHISDTRMVKALQPYVADLPDTHAVVFGDRIETAKLALDLHYKGVRVIHCAGGETRHGDPRLVHPDHRCRDAISMLARLHFVSNQWCADNLKAIGITQHVYVTGCCSLDEIVALSKTPAPERDGSVFSWFPESIMGYAPYQGPRLSEADFLQRLRTCGKFRTNSSAGLREAPILGTPVEMVGNRQAGRAPAGTYHDKDGLACYNIRKVILEHCHE